MNNFNDQTSVDSVVINHCCGKSTTVFFYRIGPFRSDQFKTESAAKSALAKHLKRGGLSAEWIRRHPELVRGYMIRKAAIEVSNINELNAFINRTEWN